MGYGYGKKSAKEVCRSFQEADNLLGSRDQKTIGNNTIIHKLDNGDIALRHWSTDIIVFKKNGNIVLDSNGYHTSSTGQRYRVHFGFSPYSYKGEWVQEIGGTLYEFDGLEIKSNRGGWEVVEGDPIIRPSLEILLKRKIPDVATLIREIQEMSVDFLLPIWRKFKNHRTFLAKHCKLEFLPLTMTTSRKSTFGGTYYKDEEWQQIVNARLRGEEI